MSVRRSLGRFLNTAEIQVNPKLRIRDHWSGVALVSYQVICTLRDFRWESGMVGDLPMVGASYLNVHNHI